MLNVLRSLCFYALFYSGSALIVLGASLAVLLGPRAVRPLPDLWAAFHNVCVRWLLGIRIRIEGERPDRPVLYAFKHESHFDAIELPNIISHPAVFAKEELFRIPFWGAAARAYGLVPVYREQGSSALRKMLKDARRLAAEGRSLVIFPEGTRVASGGTPPLRAGFAGIYKAVGLPVVPVAVDSGPLYHRRWKRPGTITYRFGEAIPPGLARAEIEARVHSAINALNASPP